MIQEKWVEAIAAFRAAVAKDPEMSEAWFKIGATEMMKHGGKYCEAAYRPFKRCVELDPNHAGAHLGLGGVLLDVRKDDVRAEKHFRAANRLDPNDPVPHRGLSEILQKQNDLDGAIREMLEYVRLSGDPDGGGKAQVAALLEKKKAGLAAKPNAEAKARPPCLRARATAACDLLRLHPL